MGNEYYPFSDAICYHVYDKGGCVFCGYKTQERCVSKTPVSIDDMISHFNEFAKNNIDDIKKAGRLVIAPNGSWFSEVPKELRMHIYKFAGRHNILSLKYECRATLFDSKKTFKEFEIMHKAKYGNSGIAGKLAKKSVEDVSESLNEINSDHVVSFGLEVANDDDLAMLNKGCCLEDYIRAAWQVRNKNAKVCCNILISPPNVENAVQKAFETAKFSVEELGADEFLVMPCIPMKSSAAYKEWVNGKWNPVSASAASEVFRIIKARYPYARTNYLDLRVYRFHGRHGKFTRKAGKWSEEEKEKEREMVREIAARVF